MIKSVKMFFLILMLLVLSFDITFSGNSNQTEQTGKPLEIVNITPTGEDVPAGRQIVIKFNRPVIPVGRMERDPKEIPIIITPELKGQWHWLDTSTLALMLDKENALSLATRYNIIIKPGIKTEDGVTLQKKIKHSFITERPEIYWIGFKTWESPGMPVFNIEFSQPVLKSSIEKHIFIRGKWKGASRTKVTVKPLSDRSLIKESKGAGTKETYARRLWLISPKKELPLDSKADFIIEPGLQSIYGPEKGIESKSFEYIHTLPSFTFLGIQCAGYNNNYISIRPGEENSLCNPIWPVSLLFSAPVISRDVKGKIIVEPAFKSGTIINDDIDYWEIDSIYNSSYWHNHEYKVQLNRDLECNKEYKIISEPGEITDAFVCIPRKTDTDSTAIRIRIPF